MQYKSRDARREHKQSVSPNVHNPHRTAGTALPGAALALHENPRSCSLERDELVGCVVSSPGTITKKILHAARLSTIHVTEMPVLRCKDKEQLTKSTTNNRDTHQSMPSGDKYSSRSIKRKIYAKCNTFDPLLRVLRMAASRKVHTPELAMSQGAHTLGS